MTDRLVAAMIALLGIGGLAAAFLQARDLHRDLSKARTAAP